jgi:hypothetical protein
MPFRLFLELEVYEYLQSLRREQRAKLLAHLKFIRDYPGNYSDHVTRHSSGRLLSISLTPGHAIFYWIDDADRHVKIIKIESRTGN